MRTNIRFMSAAAVVLLLSAVAVAAPPDLRVNDAARNQDAGAVRALLAEGAAVDAVQPDGFTALHWAAQWDHSELAGVLIAVPAVLLPRLGLAEEADHGGSWSGAPAEAMCTRALTGATTAVP